MDFSFLHAADLHLGSPFLGLSSDDEELAKLVASASRQALEELVDIAIDRNVKFLLIAGDIYDGDWKDTSIGHFFNRQMGKLHRAGIPVYLVKGNHDAESVITKAVTLPQSVRSFSSRKAETFRIEELKVAIHGQSFADRAVTTNLVSSYPDAEPGWFNIGLLHTSCEGRPGHASYAPCDVSHLLQRGYQYWALGHVHNYEVLNETPPIIFPGNLQGRHVRECGPKGAVLVEVRDSEVHTYSRLLVDKVRWAAIEVDLTGVTLETEALKSIRQAIQNEVAEAADIPVVFRMILTGSTPLHRSLCHDLERIEDEVESAANHCTDQIWVESVKVLSSEPSATSVKSIAGSSFLDFKLQVQALTQSPEVLQETKAAMEIIKGKLPSMDLPEDVFSEEALARLIDEAHELLLLSSTGVEGGQA